MSYQKQNFANGEVLTASQLNHIEDGIVDVESAVNENKAVVNNIIDPTLSVSGKAADAKAVGTIFDDVKTKKAEIDDSTVGLDAWSSKHIVDMLCPPLEETGNPVQCYPVTGYPLGCKVSWEPTQEGSGDPSPDNIRPIKGRDSVTVERCGENAIEFLSTENSSENVTIATDAEKNITLNGTLVRGENIIIGMCRMHWVAGKTYTMYVKKVGGSVSLGSGDGITFAHSLFTTDYERYFRGSTNSTNFDEYIARGDALVETELVFMLQCWRANTVFNNYKFQIEVVPGTTAPTAYSPYTGQTSTLTLPHTIYGGEVDAVTGEGQETWKLLTLDGTENYVEEAPKQYSISLKEVSYSGKCSHFKSITLDELQNHVVGAYMKYTGKVIFNTNFSSLDEFKHYLRAQFEAGTPIQICYTRTPNVHNPTFTATGVQPIPALSGVNTVLTDADSATVTGRADPIKRIIDLEDAVASMT